MELLSRRELSASYNSQLLYHPSQGQQSHTHRHGTMHPVGPLNSHECKDSHYKMSGVRHSAYCSAMQMDLVMVVYLALLLVLHLAEKMVR